EAKFNKGARCWTEGTGDQTKYFYEYKSDFGPIRENLTGERMKIFYAYERWVDKLTDVTADAVLLEKAKPPPLPKGAEADLAMAAKGAPAVKSPVDWSAVAPPSSKKPPSLSLAGGTAKEAMELGADFGFKDKAFLKQVGKGAEPGKFNKEEAKKAFQALDEILCAARLPEGSKVDTDLQSVRRAFFMDVVQGKMTADQAKDLAAKVRSGE